MVDVAKFFGANETFARQEMFDVLKFEIQLANFSLPREQRRNASRLYNPMKIKDLSKYDPYTPWLEYINNILTKDILQVIFFQLFLLSININVSEPIKIFHCKF